MTPIPPIPNPSWPLPKFNLQIQDLEHPGVEIFLDAVRPKEALQIATKASHQWLYAEDNPPPQVEELLLVLRAMPGVAHATGSRTHKQIHLSLDYIKGVSKDRVREEILGVLVHEAVHCFQYNGNGSCPGGLVEGIADFVRLQTGFAPPHWKRHIEDRQWDAGYDTTAYFLQWIEVRYGIGTVRELNGCMKDAKYHRKMFKELTGRPVRKLWTFYCASVKGEPEPTNYGADGEDDDYDLVQIGE